VHTLEIRVNVNDSLFASIREALSLRSMTLNAYLLQVLEADVAPIRLQKLRSNFLLPSGVKAKTIETTDGVWRTKLRGEQIQRIIFLSEREKMSPPDIAASMAISRTSVRRVLNQRAEARTPVPLTSSSRRSRGQRAQP